MFGSNACISDSSVTGALPERFRIVIQTKPDLPGVRCEADYFYDDVSRPLRYGCSDGQRKRDEEGQERSSHPPNILHIFRLVALRS